MKAPHGLCVPPWLRVAAFGTVLTAAAGAMLGVHNAAVPTQPSVWRGAAIAGSLGLLFSVAIGLACDFRLRRPWRAAAGAAIGAIVGGFLGMSAFVVAAPDGLLGAGVGAGLGAALLAVPLPRTLLVALAVFAVTGLGDPRADRPTPPPPTALDHVENYDISPRPVGRPDPGTVVDSPTPQGWSSRVLMLDYKVGTGDVDRLPAGVADSLALFSHVYLARVRAEPRPDGPPRYRLTDIAVGMSTLVGGRDTVLTGATLKALGANLDLVAQAALAKHEERLKEDRRPRFEIVARSDTMAVIDSPIYVNRGGRHRPAVMRQAWLIDPADGRLEPLFWLLPREGEGFRPLEDPVAWMTAGGRPLFVSHVDAREFTFGLPLKEPCMAIEAPPVGRPLAVSPELRGLLNRAAFTEDEARSLERLLRQAVADFPAGN
jgi:hypothetical protein